MKSHRDLEIFQEAKRLAIEAHKTSLTFHKFELYEEGGQIRRSSKAIASSIAEGYGRKKYKADFVKHLIYSHAECDETIVHLEFLFEAESLKDAEKFQDLSNAYNLLGRRINKYIQWVEEHWNENL